MKKTLLSFALMAALGAVSVPASAYTWEANGLPFTVTETAAMGADGVIPGLLPPSAPFVADKLSGEYSESFSILSFTPTGGVSGFGTFNTLAFFDLGNFFMRNGNTPPGAVATNNHLSLPDQYGGYGVYALFQSSGSFMTDVFGKTVFTGVSGGSLELYLDKNKDSTKTNPVHVNAGDTVTAITRSNASDDILLGSATSLFQANGKSDPVNSASGDFEIVFNDFALTTGTNAGDDYFTSPNNFHTVLDINGNFQSFTPTGVGDVSIQGSANSFFLVLPVPEPATLALLGVGLVGMGFASRRRKA